ncbi:MAG TPA: peptidase E [Jatrophihabitans sp.]|jgi:peptidase E|nr:peptidase E [Jatrophihabitans sp.]
MTAAVPTILATSGGLVPSRRLRWEVGPLTDYAVELAGVSGRAPRVCFLATAMGDNSEQIKCFYDAAVQRGFSPSHLALFPMPNVEDPAELLLNQDVIWVFGGSVAGLLAMWRLHGIDLAMRAAWQAGVVLTGVSAGSICWHSGGTTDSFGVQLRPVTNGLALVPFSNGVHYDSEEQRRPAFQSLIGDGTLAPGYATEDGTGVLYRGEQFVEAVTEQEGKTAYYVSRSPDGTVTEQRLDTRLLKAP